MQRGPDGAFSDDLGRGFVVLRLVRLLRAWEGDLGTLALDESVCREVACPMTGEAEVAAVGSESDLFKYDVRCVLRALGMVAGLL